MKELFFKPQETNEVYPGALCFEPMRMWKLPEKKEDMLPELCSSGVYFGQIKKDGYFYALNRAEENTYLFSRNVSVSGLLSEKSQNVPHITEAFKDIPKDTIIIGEIYVKDGTSKDVTRIMGCLPELAIKRQEDEGKAIYYIYDIISYDGVSLFGTPAIARYEILKTLYAMYNLAQYDYIELAGVITENIYDELDKALRNGEEGLVLKRKDSPYIPGKKPAWQTIKCKKVDYADVVCMGFEDATPLYSGKEIEDWEYWFNPDTETFYPTGKHYPNTLEPEVAMFYTPVTKAFYYGWKMSVIIGAYDNEGKLVPTGTVSSGLTDELREEFAKNPANYIGKVMFVECMEKDSEAKSIRHGIFKGFREDKNAQECKLEEVFL